MRPAGGEGEDVVAVGQERVGAALSVSAFCGEGCVSYDVLRTVGVDEAVVEEA